MPTEITMPKLSDTMTEGKLISWKKGVGDRVERGDIVAEVETDKANMELEAFTSGVLLETRVEPGDMVEVGAVIALVGKEGEKPEKGEGEEKPEQPREEAGKTKTEREKPPEEPEEAAAEAAADAEPAAGVEKPEKEHPPREKGGAGEEISAEGKTPEEKPASAAQDKSPEQEPARPVKELEEGEPPPAGGAVAKASPLVRRLAREKGIDLAEVEGSGPEGRIVREDLEKAESGESGGEATQPLSRMRGAIARTVAEAWRTIPHFSVTVEADMGEAERVRQELKSSGTQVSLNDFIVKAAATAIGTYPLINASFSADGITMHPGVNIGIAVALDDGLLVPVIAGCEALPLREIAARSHTLIKRAKEGAISEKEITGGTFSVSNLGMYGVEEFTAVILPPQGAILAVGAVADRPVISGGHLAAARMMRLTLSADHRLIDGAYAAKFLREVKRVLENPVTMLV